MAVYREMPPAWRKRLPLILGIASLVLAVLVVVAVISAGQARQVTPSQVAYIHTNVSKIAQSLQQFGSEYTKIAQGTGSSTTGATADLNDAFTTFAQVEPDLTRIDSAQAQAVKDNLNTLQTILKQSILNGAKPDPDTVTITIVRASQHMAALLIELQKSAAPTTPTPSAGA